MHRFQSLILAFLFVACLGNHAAAQVYIAYSNTGVISKFDSDTGAMISEEFILGLKRPRGICYANGVLYVVQSDRGWVSKYNAQTGATINEEFITGLNMPQAIAVAGGKLYVASFAWPGPEGGQAANLIGKFNAITGAAINYSLVKTEALASNLAANDQKLYVIGGSQLKGASIFDANTGAPVPGGAIMQQLLNGSWGVALSGHSLWSSSGGMSAYGVVFKFDTDSGELTYGDNFIPPLIPRLDHPSLLAISGNVLYVGGPGTSVSTYNAITGELIKAALIRDFSDRFGGLAVVPTAAPADATWAETTFSAKNALLQALFWMSMNGDYLSWAAVIFAVVGVFGLLAVHYFRSGPQVPDPEPVPEEIALQEPEPALPADGVEEPALAAAPSIDENVATEPAPLEKSGTSLLTVAMFVVFGVTLVVAGVLAWFAFQSWPSPNYMPHEDTSDLIGVWSYENNLRQGSEMPVLLSAEVHSTHLDFSSGNGMIKKQGQWRDNAFWCDKPDGSGEMEAARIISPEELELHRNAFEPESQAVDVLYKRRGTDAEVKAIADKYPSLITYPPPAGVIKYWMTEYELLSLPWQPDHIEIPDDPAYARRMIYIYRSDNPHLEKLQVTVKNHRVVEVKGGNG